MNDNYEKPTLTEMYHHGILGQKWGVRRYQNEDGTLTPAGKDRYLNGDSKKSGIKKVESKTDEWEAYGYKGSNTKTKYSKSVKSSNDAKNIDEYAKNELYDPADRYDVAASHFIKNLGSKGEKFALKALDKEMGNISYDLLVKEESINEGPVGDINVGAKYVMYALKVYGDEYIYNTSGDKNYSDNQYFEKREK